jgi:uncharacterized protein with HEPN domain
MSPRKDGDQAFLDDMRKACALLLSKTKTMQLPDFVADTFFQHGAANLLLIIGEAAKNISPTTQRRYPSLNWKGMVRLRDLFAHHYWTIEPIKMWNIVQKEIPKLMDAL